MTKNELNEIKLDLIKSLTDLARNLYSSRDETNKMKVGGIAQCIEFIKTYQGPKKHC